MTSSSSAPNGAALAPAPWRLVAIAVAITAVTLLGRLGGLPLLDPDEGRNAAVASEMQAHGAWIVPTYNGLAYMDKPAFFFRAVALCFGAFGADELSARLPSTLAALALLAAAAAFARRVYGGRVAALTAIVLATAPLFVVFARTVIFDMPLALCVCTAIFTGYLAEEHAEPGGRRRLGLASAFASGVAVLIKGPVGWIVPVLVLAAFFASERRFAAARRTLALERVAVVLALVLPWFVAACVERPDFAHYGLVYESFQRFTTDEFRRTQPFYFYVPVMLLALAPWSLAAPEAALAAWRERARLTRADRLLLVWVAVVVAFFSISRSKLPGYVLSAVVAGALLSARLVDRALADRDGRAARILDRSLTWIGVAAIVGAAVAIASMLLGADSWQRLLGRKNREIVRLVPLFGPIALTCVALAASAGWAARRRSLAAALLVVLVIPTSALTASFPALRRYAEAASARSVAAAVARESANARVVSVRSLPPGLPFYLGRPITLVTEDGHESTSNYQMSLLRGSGPWPEGMIPLGDAAAWLDRQREPIYLLAYWRRREIVESMLASRGLAPTEIAPGWWGVLVPPRAG
ncbi:MAG: glycosyltransferase family 39 protein [bacterium]